MGEYRIPLRLRSRRWSRALAGLVFLLPLLAGAEVGEAERFLEAWLTRQAEVKSWTADVVQTRKLQSLVRPLESRGRVWVRPPNQFRWQLGEPPRTIAVRTENNFLVVYPQLGRIERYALTGDIDPAWRQVLALLELGFPSEASEFYARYEPIASEQLGNVWRFQLRPVARAARRLIDRVHLEIAKDDFTIRATELVFPDESVMRNDFSHHQLNVDIDDALFAVEAAEKYPIVDVPSAD